MMRIIVKFDGTSVQNPERLKKAAQSIIWQVKEGYETVIVVSAYIIDRQCYNI